MLALFLSHFFMPRPDVHSLDRKVSKLTTIFKVDHLPTYADLVISLMTREFGSYLGGSER